MTIEEKITQPAGGLVGTANGRILLDESRGELIISSSDGKERTKINVLGLTTIREDGTYANRVGQAKKDGRSGIWSAKEGVDLKQELDGGN